LKTRTDEKNPKSHLKKKEIESLGLRIDKKFEISFQTKKHKVSNEKSIINPYSK
jgi:hypothetical protein